MSIEYCSLPRTSRSIAKQHPELIALQQVQITELMEYQKIEQLEAEFLLDEQLEAKYAGATPQLHRQ